MNRGIAIAGMLVMCHGCIEPYQPDIEESDKILVIEGNITDLPGIQTITISRSASYAHPRFQPVSGCVVRVEDENGEGITYLEAEEGIYQSQPDQDFLAVGKAYKLLVFTPGGETYESDYDPLLACASIEELSYQVEKVETSNPVFDYYGIRFYADVKGNPGDSRNYLWTFEETWEYLAYYNIQYIWDGYVLEDYTPQLYGYKICYMTDRIEEMQVGSSILLEKNEIHQQPLYFVSNKTPRLQEQYCLRVFQHSLSHGAFLYWDKMKAQTGDTGGLFETQPSSSRGNIYNVNDPDEKVLGYFFASQVKEKRIMVSEAFEFPIVEFDCPLDTANTLDDFGVDYPYIMFSMSPMGQGPPYGYAARECHDCTYRGGVTTKPDYWDE